MLSGAKQLSRTLRLERDLAWGVSRGTLEVAPGGVLENAATLTLADDAAIEDAGGALRNLGALRKLGAARVDLPAVENAAGATLTATGTIGGSLVNAGTVAPGTSPGDLTIDGDFTQSPGGTLAIELAGGSAFDRLIVTGAATLDGTLAVQRDSAFSPAEGDAFTFLTAGSRSGAFAAISGADVTPTLGLEAEYDATSARLRAARPPEVSVGDDAVAEENAGTSTLGLPVTLTRPLERELVLTFATADGTATAPADYAAAGGKLTIPAGTTTATIAVTVVGDAEVEPDETLTVTIAVDGSPATPLLADGTATGTITNDDSAPAVLTPPPAAAPSPAPPASPGPVALAPKPSLKQVVKLPGNRRCVSRRGFRIRLLSPSGVKVVRARVLVSGRQVAVRRGSGLRSRIDLRILPKGRFKVRVEITLADGRTIRGTRRYRACVPRPKSQPPRSSPAPGGGVAE